MAVLSDAVQRAYAALPPTKVSLTARTQFQALQTRGDGDTNLALHAERLQRDRIVGAADQHITANPDAECRAALGAGIIAGEIAGPEPVHWREHAPGQRGLLRDAEVEAHFTDGGDIEVVGLAGGAEHAAEIGHGADDEADAGAAAAFQHADLHLSLLRGGRGKRCRQGKSDTGKGE